MMRSAAVTVIGAVLLVGTAAMPGQAATSRDLYMVRDVEKVEGFYIGEFGVLRKEGKSVVGALGAFSSEYGCLKGTVRSGKLRGMFYPLEGPGEPTKYTKRWVGSGDQQRLAGFQSVGKKQMRVFLEGQNPSRFLNYCLTHV